MKVTQTYQKAEGWMGVSETKLQKALRIALRAAVVYRHLNYMDFHFREAAYSRYPNIYQQRKTGSKNPRRLEQEKRPLYHTGNTRQQVLGTVRFSTRAQKGSSVLTATASFNVPGYLWFMKRFGYDPGKELEATNRGEMATMTGVVNAEIQKEIDNQGDVKVHRIRL